MLLLLAALATATGDLGVVRREVKSPLPAKARGYFPDAARELHRK